MLKIEIVRRKTEPDGGLLKIIWWDGSSEVVEYLFRNCSYTPSHLDIYTWVAVDSWFYLDEFGFRNITQIVKERYYETVETWKPWEILC